MAFDYMDIVSYITKNYPKAKRIVEIGIGREDAVLNELKKAPDWEAIGTDISPQKGIVHDDVVKPYMQLYVGADLIYSIRPPPEIIPHIQRIARDVGADLLIRPLTTDSSHKPATMRLVNYGTAIFWEKKY